MPDDTIKQLKEQNTQNEKMAKVYHQRANAQEGKHPNWIYILLAIVAALIIVALVF